MASAFECMQFSTRVYSTLIDDNTIGVPLGWTMFDHVPDTFTGFSAGTFYNKERNELVITYTGTNEFPIDPLAGWSAGAGLPAPQIFAAISYYFKEKQAHPTATISFSGHSLGGGLASLMAVFFDKQAIVFDEAPFEAAARSLSVLAGAAATLALSGTEDAAFSAFLASVGTLTGAREANITQYSIEGEALSYIRTSSNTLVGTDMPPIFLENSTASKVERHSMTLLTAVSTSGTFLAAVRRLPDLVSLLASDDLFAAGASDRKPDLLRKLLKNQLGVLNQAGDSYTLLPNAMLDRFGSDMCKVAILQDNTTGAADLNKAMIVFGMQAYYDDKLPLDQELFTVSVGGDHLRFDRAKVADSYDEMKGKESFEKYLTKSFVWKEKSTILEKIGNTTDWYIRTGFWVMNATAEDRAAFMLGGVTNDTLTGSDKDDLLVGGDGNDTLTSNGGKDTLLGGNGDDTFILHATDGNGLTIYGGTGYDVIAGTEEKDTLDLGNARIEDVEEVDLGDGDDVVKVARNYFSPAIYHGDNGKDTIDGRGASQALQLYGDGGDDTLFGGGYNDSLVGGDGADLLEGGAGKDIYLAGDGDTIKDSDGSGKISFADIRKLSGGTQKEVGSQVYEGNNGETYTWSGSTLTVEKDGAILTIKDFTNDSLEIHLEDKKPEPPNPIMEGIRDLFARAEQTISPLILDLDGDGVETVDVKAGAHFDHAGDGFAEQTGWAGADDGLLVYDRNGNGRIDSGAELFGNNTVKADGTKAANGFEALAEFDTNHDGRIDEGDAAYASLRVWKDANGNGYTEAGELLTLAQAGVQSINTGYGNSTLVDANGSAHKQVGSFTRTDGSAATLADVWFGVDNMYTIARDQLALPADIAALPELHGYGQVYDLRQAMARDASGHLKDLVGQFAAESDSTARTAIVTRIMYAWAGVENIDPASRGCNIDAQKLATLEAFLGEKYWNAAQTTSNPYYYATQVLLQAFDQLADTMSWQLMAQTHLKALFQDISFSWDTTTKSFVADVTQPIATLQAAYDADANNGMLLLREFAQCLDSYGDVGKQVLGILQRQGDINASGFAFCLFTLGRQPVTGDAGNNTLSAVNNATSVLLGFAGDDILNGGQNDDILAGGSGNDTLAGGGGNNTYIFNAGDGQDTINITSGADTVTFGTGIAPADLHNLSKSDNNLVVKIGANGDQLTFNNWFAGAAYRPGCFTFADGTVMTVAEVSNLGMIGTAGDDTIALWPDSSVVLGNEGNDTLIANSSSSNYTLDGGAGDDTITSSGTGTNVLRGGAGNDTINFSYNSSNTIESGDGNDLIKVSSPYSQHISIVFQLYFNLSYLY